MAHAGIEPKLRALLDLAIANLAWRGRASRKTLFISIGLLYAFGLLSLPLGVAEFVARPGTPTAVIFSGLYVGIGLVIGAFFLGAMVRRLHDRGKASWWLLLFVGPQAALVFLAARFLPGATSLPPLFFVAMIIDGGLLFWWMSETFFLRGTVGPNRFGEDPLADTASKQVTATA